MLRLQGLQLRRGRLAGAVAVASRHTTTSSHTREAAEAGARGLCLHGLHGLVHTGPVGLESLGQKRVDACLLRELLLWGLAEAALEARGLVVDGRELSLGLLESSLGHLLHLRYARHVWLHELVWLEARRLLHYTWVERHARLLWLEHAHVLLLLLLLHHHHHPLLSQIVQALPGRRDACDLRLHGREVKSTWLGRLRC